MTTVLVASGRGDPRERRVRPAPLPLGLVGAGAAALVGGASEVSRPLLAVAVAAVQLALSAVWLAALDAPGSGGAFALLVGVGAGSDAVLLNRDDAKVGGLAGVVGVAVVAALLHQLTRRQRSHVTESMGAELSGALLVTFAASPLALRNGPAGPAAAALTAFALAAAVGVGRLVDLLLARPALPGGASRGVPGLLAGLAAAAGVGAGYGRSAAGLSVRDAVLLAAGVGLVGVLADLVLDVAAAEVRWVEQRRRTALLPLAVVLPLAATAPVGYLIGRLLLN